MCVRSIVRFKLVYIESLNLHYSGLGLSHVSLGHELELIDSSVNDVILNDAFVCILYLI